MQNRNLLLLITGLLLLTSCEKLSEEPAALLTTEQFYKTQADAVAAVTSVYNALNASGQTIYNSLFQIGMDIASDDALPGPRARNANVRSFAVLSHATTNDRVEEIWKQHYAAINRANVAIDRIPAIVFDDQLKARLIKEAKFLRALYYFNLVRLYGEVPLVLHEPATLGNTDIFVKRNTVEEVYKQIIADLQDAETLPPAYGSQDIGRATGGAAKSMLTRVYLTRQNWDKTIEKALEVINGPYAYNLFAEYAEVFNKANNNGKEHIFSAQFKSLYNGNGNSLGSRATPTGVPGIDGGDADVPTPEIYALFQAADKRRDVTFYTSLVSPSNGNTYNFSPHFRKFYDASVLPNTGESGINFPIIRYADVLLQYAEALNEKNGPVTEAYNAVNRIRARAGLPDLSGLSKDQFRDSLYKERRLEFVYEHQRWFDLVRTKKLEPALKAVGKTNVLPRHYLYPIPQRERDLNPLLTQNDGWTK